MILNFFFLQTYLASEQFEQCLHLIISTGKGKIHKKAQVVQWAEIVVRAQRLARCVDNRRGFVALPFAYIKGIVAEAAEMGHWLLGGLR